LIKENTSAKKLYLLDVSSYLYRAFHALPKFTTKEGFPTGAIYGFTRMLMSLLTKKKVKYLGVCFDSKAPTFRHEQFEDYKANRPPMPDDLLCQLPKIVEILNALNLARFQMDGYEADDILATLASKFQDDFDKILVITSDKDMLQLVNEKINIWDSFRGDSLFDSEKVKEKLGVSPEKVPDFLALIGDSVDNIPGIPGIGKITAKKLINEWGSLENLITSRGKIKDRQIAKSLEKYASDALASKQLIILKKDVPLKVSRKGLEVKDPDWAVLKQIFDSLQFKKFTKQLGPSLFS
jgi:DNA polymerase-1